MKLTKTTLTYPHNAKKFILHDHPGKNMQEWLQEAKLHKCPEHNAMTVATVNNQNQPDIRTVYLKKLTTNYDLIFYTSDYSQKAENLKYQSRVAVCFYWAGIMKQLRIKGSVTKMPPAEAEKYFLTRPRNYQISSWASQQSHPLPHIEDLYQKWQYYEQKFQNQQVPMPRHWTGFIITGDYFEFWLKNNHRLHNRYICELKQEKWQWSMIQP